MDFFAYNFIITEYDPGPPVSPSVLVPGKGYGTYLNGIEKAMWIERYNQPGEFEIEARLSSGIKDLAPVGCYISHVNSRDIAMVESHEITDEKDKDPVIKISGKTILGFMEHRIVGVNCARYWPNIDPAVVEDVLPADYIWNQIATLINHHTSTYIGIFPPPLTSLDQTWNEGDSLGWTAYGYMSTTLNNPEQVERTIERGPLLDRVIELLKIEDFGMRVSRTFQTDWTDIEIQIDNGIDRTAEVIFSWNNGDFERIQYLFTNKGYKNAALVFGSKVWQNVNGNYYDDMRRTAEVDASDIDGFLTALPTNAQLTRIRQQMTTRGNQFIKKQRMTNIVTAEVSSNASYRYRDDYQMGDLVAVEGRFDQKAIMRVFEHAEVWDENGFSAHPTLVPFVDLT